MAVPRQRPTGSGAAGYARRVQGTLTVLFTDAVASTEALARLGDEQFETVQQAHLDLLRAPVAEQEGREVKSLGDGLMVAFSGAADALACAVAMQQAVDAADRRGEEGLPLRVGVSAGDVTVADDGDVHGTAVVEAARLCAAATGGQVLGTETVRVLAGSRGGHAFTALGPVELKGLADPVPVVEVGWAPLAEGDRLAPVPLPPRLAFESAWGFVGRGREVECLDALWDEVVAGSRRLALLAGEPGAGKTRLAREIAVRAHEQGALVLFGRVDEDMAVAYQPFAEALRHYLASVDEATRERILGLRGGVLARLVPELVDDPSEGQVDALAVFDGIVDWLSAEAVQRPVLMVLDDLHWAARPTLQALLHLLRSESLGHVLIVGTYRDTDLDRKHPLTEVLADLRREEAVERLPIRGLDSDGVEAFVRSARGDELDDAGRELAHLLSEQTQGNPFFVGQVLRHLAESGAVEEVDGRWVAAEGAGVFELPEGVREVVGRRVSRLSEQAGELLTVAAVAGPEFDAAIVAEVAGQPTAQALDGFDEAATARLLLETEVPGRLRFAHAMVRQTLEDELSTLRRLHLHQQIGLALERRFGNADGAVSELAHHFAEAAAVGEGERAARYAERAAVQALDRGAPAQAAELLQRALELLPTEEADPDGRRRDRLYAQLASCRYTLWDLERIEATAQAWLALAKERRDYGMRVNATVWLLLSWTLRKTPETAELAEITETLRIDPDGVDVGDDPRLSTRGVWSATDAPGLRAFLLGNIALVWGFGVPLEALGEDLPAGDPLGLAEEACRVATASADPEITDDVNFARLVALTASPNAEVMLRDAERTVAVGYPMGGGGLVQLGLAHVRLGRLDDLPALSAEELRIAKQTGDRVMEGAGWGARAIEALLRGSFEDARIATERSLQAAPDQPTFQMINASLTVARLLAEGHPDDARPIAEALDGSPALDNSHLVGAVAAAQGDLETAGAVLAAWHTEGRPLPSNFALPGRLWGLAECTQAVGDADAARHLYEPLTAYDGQLLLFGIEFCPASAAFTLGLLAETFDDRDRALGHYTEALEFEERIGATVLAARTREALSRIG